jgi:cytochrome d ubiquinol oxidase subunit II
VMINSIAPHWEGNQVWFVTAGGAIFAAWPFVYATAFSGFYFAMLAVLWALFFRPVGFDYRSKVADPRWRSFWDWGLFVGGAVPPIIFGVAFGNLFLGVPFQFDNTLRVTYTGGFFDLLTPFPLLCGLVSLAMLVTQGAHYLMLRTEGDVALRSKKAAIAFNLILIACFAIAGVWIAFGIPGYFISGGGLAGDPSDPLAKQVIQQAGAWLANYQRYPATLFLPVIAFSGMATGLFAALKNKGGLAFIASSLTCATVISTAGASLFPFIMPSSSHPQSSLTAWDATSSHLTLAVMLGVVLLFLPLVVIYTSWAYRVMRGKVTSAFIEQNSKSVY